MNLRDRRSERADRFIWLGTTGAKGDGGYFRHGEEGSVSCSKNMKYINGQLSSWLLALEL
jgi:hypothetical protein